MTRIVIRILIWDSRNSEHIKKHKVTRTQVEEIAKNIIAHKKAKFGRYIIIGRSGSRIISVVIMRQKIGVYYTVTARDAAKEERKRVYEKEKV